MSTVWRVTFECRFADGGIVAPSIHYHTESDVVRGEIGASEAAARVWEHLGNEFASLCQPALHIDSVVTREEVEYWNGAIPATGAHPVDVDGTSGSINLDLPRSLSGIINLKTDAAIRSGHGWIMCPPHQDKGAHTGGHWLTTSWYYTALQAFAAKITDEFDQSGTDTRHYKPVVYSQTRRRRGDSNYWFHVTAAIPKARPTWVRSRLSTP